MTRGVYLIAGLLAGLMVGYELGSARGQDTGPLPPVPPAQRMSGSTAGRDPAGATPPASRHGRPIDPTSTSGPAAGVRDSGPFFPEGSPSVPATIPASVAASVPDDGCTETAATWLARQAVGEYVFPLATRRVPDETHQGIAQTAHNVARWRGSLLDALRALGPRIHGIRKRTRRRQALLAELPACGDEAPAGWRDCRDTPDDCDGDWRLYREGWGLVREWSKVAAIEPPNVCPGEPIAYGCSGFGTDGSDQRARCYDDTRALARGLCLLDCGTGEAMESRPIHFWAKPGNGCEADDALTIAARVRADSWCAERQELEVCR